MSILMAIIPFPAERSPPRWWRRSWLHKTTLARTGCGKPCLNILFDYIY